MGFLAPGRRFGILPLSEEAPMERAVNRRGDEYRVAQGASLEAEQAREPTRKREGGDGKNKKSDLSLACGLAPCRPRIQRRRYGIYFSRSEDITR